jgi:hypothetical protein
MSENSVLVRQSLLIENLAVDLDNEIKAGKNWFDASRDFADNIVDTLGATEVRFNAVVLEGDKFNRVKANS